MTLPTLHVVCTRTEARALIDQHERFWVSRCGCREARGHCEQSRLDVCLLFRDDIETSGSGRRELDRAEVERLLEDSEAARLVPRPFRDYETHRRIDGVCFCCGDCCSYFLSPEDEPCEVGALVERTDLEGCTHCGLCEDVCQFHARPMVDGRLVVNRERCAGCGVCVEVCPEGCVEMVTRPVGSAVV